MPSTTTKTCTGSTPRLSRPCSQNADSQNFVQKYPSKSTVFRRKFASKVETKFALGTDSSSRNCCWFRVHGALSPDRSNVSRSLLLRSKLGLGRAFERLIWLNHDAREVRMMN